MLHLDNELFRVESCRVERARHESCRCQEGSSRNLSLSRRLVKRVVVFLKTRDEKCRDDIRMTLDNDFKAVERSSAL